MDPSRRSPDLQEMNSLVFILKTLPGFSCRSKIFQTCGSIHRDEKLHSFYLKNFTWTINTIRLQFLHQQRSYSITPQLIFSNEAVLFLSNDRTAFTLYYQYGVTRKYPLVKECFKSISIVFKSNILLEVN